jgi:hypothetical protein
MGRATVWKLCQEEVVVGREKVEEGGETRNLVTLFFQD